MTRVLIIGAGKMGRAHAAAFRTLDDVEIVGIASRSGESAERLAREFRVRRWSSDWRALAAETEPDACVVAVAHLLNEAITREVITSGFHVLAEKPVARTAAGAHALADEAERKGVIAMAAMNRRFFPSVTAAIDLARFHGPLAGVTVIAPDPVRPYRAMASYDRAVYDEWMQMNTLHAIDLLRLAGGQVASVVVRSRVHAASQERSIVALLEFEQGGLGIFIGHSSVAGEWELRLDADGVELQLRPLERGFIRIGSAPARPLPESKSRDGLMPGLRQQARAFAEAVRSSAPLVFPASDLRDHARSLELCAALQPASLERTTTSKVSTAGIPPVIG